MASSRVSGLLTHTGGDLPTARLGRYYRYRLDAIEAWELAGGIAAGGEQPRCMSRGSAPPRPQGRLLSDRDFAALRKMGDGVNARLLQAQLAACDCAPDPSMLQRLVSPSIEDGHCAPALRFGDPIDDERRSDPRSG